MGFMVGKYTVRPMDPMGLMLLQPGRQAGAGYKRQRVVVCTVGAIAAGMVGGFLP